MKNAKQFLFGVMLLLISNIYGQVIDNPKPGLKLAILQEEGTNGCAIAYNPTQGLYYAVIAGNATFPLEVFNAKGENVYQTTAGSDIRGIWWNPKTKQLEGNGYDDVGIVAFNCDKEGLPTSGNSTVFSGNNHQPLDQSVGTFDPIKKMMLYYENGSIYQYTRKKGLWVKSTDLKIDEVSVINNTSMIYTGKKDMEYGLLDYQNKKVLLFSAKTGALTKTIQLPSTASTNASFRFGYANGHVFLFDADERIWTGYKVFI